MNTTTAAGHEHGDDSLYNKPGAQLSLHRIQKGYTLEYVASKLHLRVRLLELLEADQYEQMPEPVFIKGYVRAYAKLLHISPDPLIEVFNNHYVIEHDVERALWQNRREVNKAEHVVRWVTGIFALMVIAAVAIWWQTNKETQHMFSRHTQVEQAKVAVNNQSEAEIRLTDLSKMRSILSAETTTNDVESRRG